MKKICLVFLCFFVLISFTVEIFSQGTCNLVVKGKNASRRIIDDVNVECGGEWILYPWWEHSPPFGNWGVDSNFGTREDGAQFDGWCNRDYLCDNLSNCQVWCNGFMETDKYQWNSCIDDGKWSAPNPDFNNDEDSGWTQQVSNHGDAPPWYVNTIDSIGINVTVDCPRDTNSDGTCDVGGCDDVVSITTTGNYMAVWELDLPGDDRVQNLYFDDITLYTLCNPELCYETSSAAVDVEDYSYPTTIQRIDAVLGLNVYYGIYTDSDSCKMERFTDETMLCDGLLPW